MAKDDDSEWKQLLREIAADTAKTEAQPRLADVSNAGPAGRRAAIGKPPGPRETPDAVGPLESDPRTTIGGQFSMALSQPGGPATPQLPQGKPPVWTANPNESDPLAGGILSGVVAGGAGKLIPAAAEGAPLFTKALQRVVQGQTEGGVAALTSGQNPATGMAIGAGLGAFAGLGAGRQARADKALFREIGRAGTEKAQGKLTELGADQIVKTARDFGIAGAKDWTSRAAASGAAKQQVGQQIGDAFKSLDAAGAQRPTTSVVQALENLKGELSKTTEGKKLAELVTAKQEALREAYPQTIPASALNKEIGDLQQIGYSGAGAGQLSPTAAKRVARMSAKAMDGELDTALAAARKDPQLAATVESLDKLNPTYRSLIAIDAIAKRQAAKEPFQKTLGERFAAEPGKTTLQVGMKAAAAPVRFAGQQLEAAGAGIPSGAAAGVAQRPDRKVAPHVVPIVQSLSEHNGADLEKHVGDAVFAP